MDGPWREPAEESTDLYPGLVVHDGRMGGAVTIGRSRLPVTAVLGYYFRGGWEDVEECWGDYLNQGGIEFSEDDLTGLFRHLLEMRGEFGRLLLVLADAERCQTRRSDLTPWWATKRHRTRIAAQLRRCLEVLEDPDL